MSSPRPIDRIRFLLLSAMVWSLLLLGCMGGPPRSSRPAAAPADPAPRTLNEVDRDIDQLKQRIKDMSEYETQQRQIAVINDVQNHKSRGWTKGDGKPSYEDLADQAYGQAAAAEKEVQRLERELARVEKEKQAILNESRGCFPADTLVQMDDGSFKRFKQIVPGDRVLTYDIGYERPVSRPVLSFYTVEANHLYTINGVFRTTGGERLLTPDGWERVRNLKPGDAVHVDGRMMRIARIDYHLKDRTLHNMQVADTHNFYVVTAEGARYLVHNSSGGHGGGGGGSK